MALFSKKSSLPAHPPARGDGGATSDFLVTRLEEMVGWARKNSLWPFPFATACCGIEFMSVAAAHYDIARFGSEVVRFSPRQADLLIVAGTVTDKMAPVLRKIYDQMPEPKWVISMGVCASSGGFYRAYHVTQGIDEIIPVDVYVPGCPPTPEELIFAIMELQKKIASGEKSRDSPLGAVRRGAARVTRRRGRPPSRRRRRSSASASRPRRWPARAAVVDLDLPTIEVGPEDWPALARFLRDDPGCRYDLFLDLCGVDNLRRDAARRRRFEAVVHLHSLSRNEHVRVRVVLPERRTGIRRFRASRASGRPPTGSSARPTTSSASTSRAPEPAPDPLPRRLRRPRRCARTTRPGQRWFYAEEDMRYAGVGQAHRGEGRPLRDADDLDRARRTRRPTGSST